MNGSGWNRRVVRECVQLCRWLLQAEGVIVCNRWRRLDGLRIFHFARPRHDHSAAANPAREHRTPVGVSSSNRAGQCCRPEDSFVMTRPPIESRRVRDSLAQAINFFQAPGRRSPPPLMENGLRPSTTCASGTESRSAGHRTPS